MGWEVESALLQNVEGQSESNRDINQVLSALIDFLCLIGTTIMTIQQEISIGEFELCMASWYGPKSRVVIYVMSNKLYAIGLVHLKVAQQTSMTNITTKVSRSFLQHAHLFSHISMNKPKCAQLFAHSLQSLVHNNGSYNTPCTFFYGQLLNSVYLLKTVQQHELHM